MLVVESPAPLSLTEHKQTGRHMPVDPTVLVLPELCDYGFPAADEYELRVKHGGAHSSIFYRNNPLVSVGGRAICSVQIEHSRHHPHQFRQHPRRAIRLVHVPGSRLRGHHVRAAESPPDRNAEERPSYHRNVDNDESVFVHHDAGSTRKPGTLSNTPQRHPARRRRGHPRGVPETPRAGDAPNAVRRQRR